MAYRPRPLVRIPANHPDAEDPLLAALGRALQGLGAAVYVDGQGENLVRALRAPREIEIPPRGIHEGPPVVEVWAQGLPNLLHEYVHVILAGRLDHDHGIDYRAIPFDLSSIAGRAVLWEELACCVLSCAYLERDDSAKTRAAVEHWFREQVEIQPVFYGMEDDIEGFFSQVRVLAQRHRAEQERIESLAYERAEATLRWAGAGPSLARAPRRSSLTQMLDRVAMGEAGTADHD